jgi:hypothetical protein
LIADIQYNSQNYLDAKVIPLHRGNAMSNVKCPKGHYYDAKKFSECPHCKAGALSDDRLDYTVAHRARIRRPNARYIPPENNESNAPPAAPSAPVASSHEEAEPVCGWLVCSKGAERGRDYPIYSGKNFIGRSKQMQIQLAGDESISRDSHCSVVYDPKNNEFYAVPGNGTLVYHNGSLMKEAVRLINGDTLELGNSALVFVPYCVGKRTWD